MRRSEPFLKWAVALFIITVCHLSDAKDSNQTPRLRSQDMFLKHLANWRRHYMEETTSMEPGHGYRTMAAMALSFVAATISSAGGVGGGPLFLPILNIVAGLDLKTAASYSAFMVTGVLLSGVLCNFFFANLSDTGEPFVNYEIAVLTEPCMLLGVSLGVICNVMFPEWLITVLFAVFLAYSTYKTCNAGFRCWKAETESLNTVASCRLSKDRDVEGKEAGVEEPLLSHAPRSGLRKVPWKDMVVLVMVWVCFFLLHVLMGNKKGKGIIHTEPCGVAFWLMKFSEVPFAVAFTLYIVFEKKNSTARNIQQPDGKISAVEKTFEVLPKIFFPLAALLTGFLSGLFGVGGGLLVNPLLLQIGLPPQTAAATSTFMLLFSSSMTMVQYVILGMSAIKQASAYALLCFVASACGSAVIQRVVEKSGRVSITIFAVTVVMALSTVIVTGVGAIDIWAEYAGGQYMGFRPPC